ncbi:hypothetical protein TNCV_3169911 [Trichonephila clavipes]|nr:hypothetical protein TNCV_3169911 [Trichonephila clavipes]
MQIPLSQIPQPPVQIPHVPQPPLQILHVSEPVQIPVCQVLQQPVHIPHVPEPVQILHVLRTCEDSSVTSLTATCADSTCPTVTCADSRCPRTCADSRCPRTCADSTNLTVTVCRFYMSQNLCRSPEPVQIPPQLNTLDPLEPTDAFDELMSFVFGPPTQELQLLHIGTLYF